MTSPPVAVTSIDLALPVELFASGWNAGLSRAPKIECRAIDLAIEKPRAATMLSQAFGVEQDQRAAIDPTPHHLASWLNVSR
jgi:hypothetical protein